MRNPLPWLVTDYWAQYLAVLGLIAAIRLIKVIWFHSVWTLKTHLPSLYRPYNYPKIYGEWAAVSGCTAGIGHSLVKEIARRGINLILISRSQEKLSSLAKELEHTYKIKTKIIINDALSRESTDKMAKELAGLDIGILVNNVGVNLDENKMKRFHHTRSEWIISTLTVNAGNGAMTMKHVLPNMIKARKGIVVNMCSSSSYSPVPVQTLYAASKVYMDILTRGIGYELESTGVKIQSFCPFFVQSNMTQFSSFIYNFLSISGEAYAKSFMDKLGTCRRTGGHLIFDLFYGFGLITFHRTGLIYLLYYIGVLLADYEV